ncbi:hypothetical protein NEHOM01_0246 [Nematocida homosporus]|uniref:uncharacterized protein n=1 Tax=Nematocida homosporus TaxID=1912981 RepID=UPI00222120FD|nr:uncharacterized protein NEHOM01_0246 [Nematocida homosporus]KAI5184571.1 hypothetical protein NEHOM01_0246 [Nematocida homosporus]
MYVMEILNRAQTDSVKESRDALDALESLISEGEVVEVFGSFCEAVSILIGCKRCDIPKSVIQFINELMKRLKQTREGRNFMHNLIKYLLRGVDSKLKHVRTNSLVLLRGSLEHLDSVSPRLWAVAKIKIGEKLFDRESAVRFHAVQIVAKYQESALDGSLSFFKLLKDLLRYDPAPEIRKAVLGLVVVNKQTISAIISRAADVNEGVRMVFVSTKLSGIVWCELTASQRSGLLQDLESERVVEIRKRFLQKMEVVFEKEFEGRYELLVEAFYRENQDNSSLERVLRELMKKHEYADGFGAGFLERATLPLLFLMRISLDHIDTEKGRDEIVLPDITVLLKSIIDASLALQESDNFEGSLSYALFGLLDYYDLFANEERVLLLKCGVYILAAESVVEKVVERVAQMIIKACHGLGSDKMYITALSTGSRKTQLIFGMTLLKNLSDLIREFPTVFYLIEEKSKDALVAEDTELLRIAVRMLVLMAVQKGDFTVEMAHLQTLALSGHQEAFLALADLAVVFKEEKEIGEWVYEHMAEVEPRARDKISSRLLLFDLLEIEKLEVLIADLVRRFYAEEVDGENSQYLHVFFHEYFRKRHWMVFATYKAVIGEIKHWKVFNDQILYWFSCREDQTYTEASLFLLVLSACLSATKSSSAGALKTKKELIQRYLDLLGKVSVLKYVFDESERAKALEMATALSKHIVKILPDNEIVKSLLFDIVSRE